MTRRFSALALVVGGIVFPASIAAAQPGDPAIGTWTLNVAKSTFNPGPAPKSLIVRFDAAGNGIHVVADAVALSGAAVRSEYTCSYDGADCPLTGVTGADVVALRRIDARTTERIDKKAGRVVQTYRRKVSADGKTMTVTEKGRSSDGKAVANTLVLERT